jgi:regulation of enolase protein 1 (concanavalin A-like superfamily)
MEKKRYKATGLANTATDPDQGDKLRFSKISGPKWLVVAGNGKLTGMPPADSAGTNRFRIRVTDGRGGEAESLLLIDVAPAGLPLPWEVDHIGRSSSGGKVSRQAGTFSLSQAGSLSGGADSVSFLWQTLSGDGQIIARVTDLKNGQAASRAGVMIRDSLAPNSRHVFIGVNGKNDFRSVTRKRAAAKSVTNVHGSGANSRIWVKLVRKGNIIRSYKSVNGKKWIPTATTKVALNKNCYIGLAVSGGAGKTTTGLFRNVKVRP